MVKTRHQQQWFKQKWQHDFERHLHLSPDNTLYLLKGIGFGIHLHVLMHHQTHAEAQRTRRLAPSLLKV